MRDVRHDVAPKPMDGFPHDRAGGDTIRIIIGIDHDGFLILDCLLDSGNSLIQLILVYPNIFCS